MDSKISTKEKILVVAQALMGKKGYAGVSMADIAKEVGITKASLYYFFKNKESIYLSVLKEIVQKVTEQYTITSKDKPSKKTLNKKIEESVEYGINNGIIVVVPEIIDFKKNKKEFLELKNKLQIMNETMQNFLKLCGVNNPQFSAQMLSDMIHAHVMRVLFNTNDSSHKEFASNLTKILIK